LELAPARPVDGVTFKAVMEDPNVIKFVVSTLPTLSGCNKVVDETADSGMTEKAVVELGVVLPLVPSAVTVTTEFGGIAVVSDRKTYCGADAVTPAPEFPTVKAVRASAVAEPPEGM
jgi:hypothetical protein